ncbi:MAG: FAD-dependent oxidoreductase [Cellulosilyticaceae bacterium]|uniref:FAD-dependent oxidoreductase n=1 Tax=Niameybacter sp. TaxID=2033640 RepID=UPI002FCBFFE9
MESSWKQTVKLAPHNSLNGDLHTDVAVIGGGLAGILIAYFLKSQDIQTIILEANTIGSGQTSGTTAKITSQHGLIYDKLITHFGKEKALQYATANQNAIEYYRTLIQEHNIECEFEHYPAYIYSTLDSHSLQEEALAAKSLGIPATFVTQTHLPFSVEGAVKFDSQAQFHPLKFIQALSKDLTIYEHTPVNAVENERIFTDKGTVTAKDIIFACHYPFINKPGYYFMRMHQERSYVVALKNAGKLDGMYLGIDPNGLSFRNNGEFLLLGGCGHRTGENSTGGNYAYLQEKAKDFWPCSEESTHWSAQDCMTLDGIPYIGQFSHSTPHWYVATGFGKWGMSSSMVSAQIISDLILGKTNDYAEVFSPLRFTITESLKSSLDESTHAIKSLSKQLFVKPSVEIDALPKGHGGIVEYEGEKVGVYKASTDETFIVSTRCPHLGCQLEWNPDELSWDCPCHGSRFDFKGNLINNPAQTDLSTLS